MIDARPVLARLNASTAAIDRLLGLIGALMMLAVMIIVSLDVGMRYIFSAPLSWSYDLIGIFLMPGIFFFLVSDTFRAHGHIAVDIVQNALGRRSRHASLFVVHGLAALFFLGVFWSGAQRAWTSFLAGEVLAGAIPWPVWLAAAFVPIGSALLLIRLVVAAVGHALSAAGARDVIELPPLSGDEGAAQ